MSSAFHDLAIIFQKFNHVSLESHHFVSRKSMENTSFKDKARNSFETEQTQIIVVFLLPAAGGTVRRKPQRLKYRPPILYFKKCIVIVQ